MGTIRLIAAALVASQLSGCFFIFIPFSALEAIGGTPDICVQPTVKSGDRLHLPDGRDVTVKRLIGKDDRRCGGLVAATIEKPDAPSAAASAP